MRAESLNGFPLLDLIRSLHTALLFIGSEKLPRSYHVLGWRAVALKSQISTIFRTSSGALAVLLAYCYSDGSYANLLCNSAIVQAFPIVCTLLLSLIQGGIGGIIWAG